MDSKLTLDRVEYNCKSNNKTMIYIKKDFLNEALQKAIYSLNLIIRNLEAYKKNQKLNENFVLNEDIEIVITTLITLAFSNAFNKILKSLYIK